MQAPLAERMRPQTLDEVLGQRAVLGPDSSLRRALSSGRCPSMILWGPPGCGKTTIAGLLAAEVGLKFRPVSAVLSGVKQLRAVLADAETSWTLEKRGTLLFVDEIHRWNKAQQDALLPHVESGRVVLVGATTENPSFEIISALRSRARVTVLSALEDDEVIELLERALADQEHGLGERCLSLEADLLLRIAALAGGDGRRALGLLEGLVDGAEAGSTLTLDGMVDRLGRADILYDKGGDQHYDVASALIKSLRGSDPDASLYWLARLIRGGEDPMFIARRLVIFASEDVGNADPRALQVAVAASQAVQLIGLPEGRIALGQAVTWLACAPKSNASYKGIDDALAEVDKSGALPVPTHLRNAPTKLAKDLGHGKGYRYPHDHPDGVVAQQYLPDRLIGRRYYRPVRWGQEKTLAERLAWWAKRLEER